VYSPRAVYSYHNSQCLSWTKRIYIDKHSEFSHAKVFFICSVTYIYIYIYNITLAV
jgi:hypothetical protein